MANSLLCESVVQARRMKLPAQGELFGRTKASQAKRAAKPRRENRRAVRNHLPDARDGLTREQRVILYQLNKTQRERNDRNVPTLMLYGRVCEHISISPERFKKLLAQLVGRGAPDA